MKEKLINISEIIYAIIVAFNSDEAVHIDKALTVVIDMIDNLINEIDNQFYSKTSFILMKFFIGRIYPTCIKCYIKIN